MGMDKKKKPVIAVAVLAILISGYFVWEKFFIRSQETVEATGTIEATTVELTAKVPGTIQNIFAKAGDKVKQGDLVAQISRNDLTAQRERDALNVAIAQNNLDNLLSGARSQQIKEAQANVNIQQVAYNQAQKDLERAETLFQAGNLSQADFENYQNKSTVAQNQFDSAKAALSLLLAGSSDDQIKAAQNQVKMTEAVLKSTDAVLADLRIISPLNGTIESKNFENGEYVAAGASLATVADLETVWINVYISTDDLPYVKIGQKTQFTVSGLNQTFQGTVAEIATRGEFTPKTIQTKKERANIVYKVKIEANNAEGILKPGMPADVVIQKNFDTVTSQDQSKSSAIPTKEVEQK
ncbi:MAG: Macrolide export protein MacA [Candidatus Dichloromethanomonas elyunquensis]|nr:MAG: Macrolide export protein MacA [Candidatus Dichloromethanomonas elyunquensis]